MLDKKVSIFVPINDMLTYASFINIPNVQVLFFDEANAYDLLLEIIGLCFKKIWTLLKKWFRNGIKIN